MNPKFRGYFDRVERCIPFAFRNKFDNVWTNGRVILVLTGLTEAMSKNGNRV